MLLHLGTMTKGKVEFSPLGPHAAIAEHWAVMLFKGIARAVFLIQVSEFRNPCPETSEDLVTCLCLSSLKKTGMLPP